MCAAIVFILHVFCIFSSLVSRGENSGSRTHEVVEQVKVLKAQIAELEALEKELDNQKASLEEDIKHLSHNPTVSTYPLMPCCFKCSHCFICRHTFLFVFAAE